MAHCGLMSALPKSSKKALTAVVLAPSISTALAQIDFESQTEIAPETCAEAVANAEIHNGFMLFQGSVACYGEGADLEGTFLLVAGQLRSIADMAVLLTKKRDPGGPG